MLLDFDYNKIFSRMEMLSSFDGRDAVAASGENNYLKVKLTLQEKPLVFDYMHTAALQLQETISRVVASSDYAEEGFTWELSRDPVRWISKKQFSQYVEEALACFALARWMEKRDSASQQPYLDVWNDMSARVVSQAFSLRAPVKRKRHGNGMCDCNDEIIIIDTKSDDEL